MIWFLIFVPVIAAALLLIFFTKKVVWWEVAAMIVPSAIIILLMNTIMISSRTSDTEYFGSYTTKVIYYEAWDEEVPCSHPIYCTGTRTDSKGNVSTYQYECGKQHPYDVDYHPEYWSKTNNLGSEYDISKAEYERLKKQFDTKTYFVELNRDYHSIDGDAYHTNFAGQPEKSDVINSEHSYTNKIKASHSIFKFEDISEKEKTRWKLYDYPSIRGYYQPIVLGQKVDAITEKKLQYLNGYFGANKQFKTFILFFTDQSVEAALKQRSYWEGGNKNEFIVCIGKDKSGNFDWVKCFSWMKKPSLEVEVEDYFNATKDLELSKFADWMPSKISQHWERRNFKDFEYLEIEVTENQMWIILIVILLYNIGISIWVVINEFENSNIQSQSNKKTFTKKSVFQYRLEEMERKRIIPYKKQTEEPEQLSLMQKIRKRFYGE